METNIFPQQPGGKTSYWNRPEGKIGTIFGLIVFLIVGYFILPFVTAALTNWINFSIVLGISAIIFYAFVIDRRIYLGFKYLYDWFIKKFFGMIWRLDPFLVAEDYIEDLRQERDNLEKQTMSIGGQKEETIATIKEKNKDKQHQLDIAAAALTKGETGAMGVATAQAKRLENFVLRLEPIAENLQKVETYLEAVHKNSGYMLQDMENELDIKREEYKAVTKGNNALKTALSCMNGKTDKRLMMENSMDYLKEDMANKLANMKYAIRKSSEVMKTIDLDNATMETEGLRMLQEYKPELFAYQPGNEPIALTQAKSAVKAPLTKYENLLK